MSGFPTANFSDSAQGLFTAGEIRSLMRVEYERAARYDYSVALMMIDVDRLEYLHDLYGYESKEEILQGVIGLLRAVTRASDFLGCMNEGRLMALFPHTTQEAATALADRLLSGSRRLKFESGSRTLRMTLSIGLVVTTEDVLPWEDFVQASEHALAYALEAGGDRYVQREGASELLGRLRADLEAEEAALYAEHERLDQLRSALPRRTLERPPSHGALTPPEGRDLRPAPRPRSEVERERHEAARARTQPAIPHEQLDGADRERFLQLVGPVFQGLGKRTPEMKAAMNQMADLLMQTAARARADAVSSSTDQQADKVGMLERRVSKLKDALKAAEDEVRRVAAMKEVDPGLASIYRTVQGLKEDESNSLAKREMLSVLFEANVKLREDLKEKHGG